MSVLHSDGRKENVKTECRKQRGGRHGKLHCIHIVPSCGLHVPSRPILHNLMLGTGVVNQIELLSADRQVVLEERCGHFKVVAVSDLSLVSQFLGVLGVVDVESKHITGGFCKIVLVLEHDVIA